MAGTGRYRGLNRKYLRPRDLRRLANLFFSSRRTVEGQYSGHHATPQRGQSVEFRDYRQYMPGDEIGTVDWKVYGRSDKLFIKIFEHQADLTVNLLVDASASMAYRGLHPKRGRLGLSKYDYACSLAASIGFLVTKQHDRIAFALAQGGLSEYMRPGSSMPHLSGILKTMEEAFPHQDANMAEAIKELAGQSTRRDLLIVFSDLLDNREEIVRSLSIGLQRGGDAILFHVLHADELKLPKIEHGLFIDSENGSRIRLNVDDIRSSYQKKMGAFLAGWKKSAGALGIDYTLCSTAEPYSSTLEHFLTSRAART